MQIIDWATVFGIAMALCILAMSVSLFRSETRRPAHPGRFPGEWQHPPDPRRGRRQGLRPLGAVLGPFTGYVAIVGWLRDNSLNDGITALGTIPAASLLVILVGMPAAAVLVGWLLAGREPPAMARQPID